MSDINLLKLYYGDPYQIDDNIIIYQPTIGEIIDYGESEFFNMLYMFVGNTTFHRLKLWLIGVDWNKISDYELFCKTVPALHVDQTRILFGDLDFSKYELMEVSLPSEPEKLKTAEEELLEQDKPKKTHSQKRKEAFELYEKTHTLFDRSSGEEVSAETYHSIVNVLREMTHIYPKTEYANGKTTKEFIISEEKDKLKKDLAQSMSSPTSSLQPLISSCVNHPGFKYNISESRSLTFAQLMDSVGRLQVIESTHALLGGMYSGFCDTSKIPKNQFDFTRSLNQDSGKVSKDTKGKTEQQQKKKIIGG